MVHVPKALNLSGFMRNSTTSCSSCFASSHPFTSSKVTLTHTKSYLLTSVAEPLVKGMNPDPDPSVIKQK